MPKDIKLVNKRRVLHSIIEEHAFNRAGISKLLNLSKPTVSDIVRQLLEEGLVSETGTGESIPGGGRKPVQLAFNPSRYYIIGIDVGGTNVVVGIVDLAGKVCMQQEIPTQRHNNESLFEKMKQMVDAMKDALQIEEENIIGLGAGIPGVTNVEEGIVVDSPALGWREFPIKRALEEVFDYPIYVDNDVNSIVLGEHWKGVAKDKSNIIYIAIGTGIGSGIILNGDLYRGSHYSAGEMGYLITSREDYQKYKPVYQGYGHLESIASGSSIGYQVSKKFGKTISAKTAFELYEKGYKEAVEVIDFAIDNLAIGIANYISLFDPEQIIIGGGVSHSFSTISKQLRKSINQYTPKSCDVIQTSLGDTAGVVGAAALFLKEHDSILTT